MKRSDERLSLIYILSDLLTLNLVLFVALSMYQGGLSLHYDGLTMVGLSIIWLMCTSLSKVYYLHLHNSFRLRLKNYVKSYVAFVGAVSTTYLIFTLPHYYKTVIIIFIVAFPFCSLLIHFLLFKALGKLRMQGRNVRRAIIVGAGKVGASVYDHFAANPDFGYHIVGFLDDNADPGMVKSDIIGKLEDIDAILSSQPVDEVIIAIPTVNHAKIQAVIEAVDYHGIRSRLIPDFACLLGNSYSMTRFAEMPVINVREISADNLYLSTCKRIFDIAFSSFAILMLAPVLITVSILIKIDSPGAIFYCPTRVGLGGRKFKVFKFRSMYTGDSDGTKSTLKNDSRVTKIGKVIRKYSLDELPQFINVLLGEMSVVGPRPHRVFLHKSMQKEVEHYMLRQYMKPGITGWAQANGWRGPTDTEEQRSQRTAHDIWYLENWSLALDLKIIYMTVFNEKTHEVAF